jgi:NADH dehydrogenase (ubiquinone) 1 alpha subcomplex subunit 9
MSIEPNCVPGEIGSQVIVPFRGEESSFLHLKPAGEPGQIAPLRIDLRDQSTLERAAAPANVVVNLLGRHFETRNFNFHQANVESAERIAEASKHAQRFIFFSSTGARPDSPSAYMRAKYFAEQRVRQILPHATIIRSSIVYGDDDRYLTKYGFMARNWPFVPIAARNARVQPVHLYDIGAALMAVLQNKSTKGKTYEIGGPKVYTHEQVLDLVAQNALLNIWKVPVPLTVMQFIGTVFGQYSTPLITKDEVDSMSVDNVVAPDAVNLFTEFGIKPRLLDDNVLSSVRQFRHPAFLGFSK